MDVTYRVNSCELSSLAFSIRSTACNRCLQLVKSQSHHRTAWLEAPGVTGPTTPHLLCVPSRTRWVPSLPSDFGIQLDSQLTVMLMPTSAVVRLKSSMVALRCLLPWVTWHQKSPANGRDSFLLRLALSSKTSQMVWRLFPKSLWKDGLRSWDGWHSAKRPRARLPELLVQWVTSDGNWSHPMTQWSRSASSHRSLPTAVWPWWLSWACSSRKWVRQSLLWRVAKCCKYQVETTCFSLMWNQIVHEFYTLPLTLIIEYYKHKHLLSAVPWRHTRDHRNVALLVGLSWTCRMVWPEVHSETLPSSRDQHGLHSRTSWVFRRLLVSGTQPVLRPTEAWRTSSDVARQNLSMEESQCWLRWDILHRRSQGNFRATYLHPPVWSSPMCLTVWLPSQRSQPQDRVSK